MEWNSITQFCNRPPWLLVMLWKYLLYNENKNLNCFHLCIRHFWKTGLYSNVQRVQKSLYCGHIQQHIICWMKSITELCFIQCLEEEELYMGWSWTAAMNRMKNRAYIRKETGPAPFDLIRLTVFLTSGSIDLLQIIRGGAQQKKLAQYILNWIHQKTWKCGTHYKEYFLLCIIKLWSHIQRHQSRSPCIHASSKPWCNFKLPLYTG